MEGFNNFIAIREDLPPKLKHSLQYMQNTTIYDNQNALSNLKF